MKILFAARMARLTQGLAARVTKWSHDCDQALHRLVSYFHHSLDVKLQAFTRDFINQCRLWCFADADHAGEYDNKSTAGCFLALVGPNTCFPLAAFSKKQTSVSISSTENEVEHFFEVCWPTFFRTLGLPPERGGRYLQQTKQFERIAPREHLCQTRPGRGPLGMGCQRKGDCKSSQQRTMSLVHPKWFGFYTRINQSIGQVQRVDFKQDSWERNGKNPTTNHWTSKTYFRVYGPYDADYKVEAQEVREVTTDWEFVGNKRHEDMMLSMFTKNSIEGVFVEDIQATIRILESGKSGH